MAITKNLCYNMFITNSNSLFKRTKLQVKQNTLMYPVFNKRGHGEIGQLLKLEWAILNIM